MKRDFVIRAPKPSDAKGLIDTYYSYYDELKENPGRGITLFKKKPSYKSELEWFRSMQKDIRSRTCIASVAEVDGRCVGICHVGHGKGKEDSHV